MLQLSAAAAVACCDIYSNDVSIDKELLA